MDDLNDSMTLIALCLSSHSRLLVRRASTDNSIGPIYYDLLRSKWMESDNSNSILQPSILITPRSPLALLLQTRRYKLDILDKAIVMQEAAS